MEQLEFHFGAGSSSQSDLIHFLDSQNELANSVLREYPAVFRAQSGAESLWVEVQGKIVSHVASTVGVFHHPLYQFPIGLIGSVATDPEFRGMGLATSLMRQTLEQLRKKGCLIAVLWSSQWEFYRSVGFVPCGREMEWGFDAPLEPALPADGVSVGEITPGPSEVAQMHRLYSQGGLGLQRTAEKFQALLTIPQVRCFVVWENGDLVAYAVLNKGSDFQDVIHEWAGSSQHLERIVRFLKAKEYCNKTLRWIGPASRRVPEFQTLATSSSVSHTALVKLLERAPLKSIYLSFLRNQGVKAEWQEELKMNEQLRDTQTDEAFLTTVFGRGTLEESLCMPVFIWGLDSV